MTRGRGLSVRLKLTLSYVGFLLLAVALLLTAAWLFLIGGDGTVILQWPTLADFARVFDPGSFGPVVFIPAAIMALGFLLVFGLVGGWILAGRMLAPLDRITAATRTAARGSLSHRIELEGRHDEFRELADSFDTMLARLEAHDAERQRFAANASHELRTPLAIMQSLLDVARSDPNRDGGEIDERLRAVNVRAIELTEALLLLSRTDQRSFVPEPVDLSLVVEEAAETLVTLAEKHGVSVEVFGGEVFTSGSPALLLQLATNLLNNAIVHNVRDGGTVRVGTGVESGSAVVVIENTGERLGPQLVATLTEPFQRGTERTGGDHAGVGLGLAIVESITRAHDGMLSLRPRPSGGLHVTVRLPLVRRPA
ncbi:two-component system sensor histidine kinase VanS [Stackebrandtia albiflava]|uniref:histidine kinase n=1 Tax=Stackebrandtia albiflava TaxID=406432 RepID=A0A562V2R8_9ACTN|nr:HAMP domain-containing sensor histidine kinase [Stackebrandtia albiflava]TWJ12112.1 two-component system sensor histidine kinase VanS [Stackebrandtia albiflava]